MSTAFLDTAGWLAALGPDQAQHRESLATYQSWIAGGVSLVTTNLVVAEMQVLLMRRRGTAAALRFMDDLYADPAHEVVFVDRDLERAAVDRWLRKFSDHPISLADAASFEVMRARRLRDVLTLDAHFRTAGFSVHPR